MSNVSCNQKLAPRVPPSTQLPSCARWTRVSSLGGYASRAKWSTNETACSRNATYTVHTEFSTRYILAIFFSNQTLAIVLSVLYCTIYMNGAFLGSCTPFNDKAVALTDATSTATTTTTIKIAVYQAPLISGCRNL